ncbi:N-acetyltransferase [Moritella marina ATCC 15381]|uniref:N-acetyltransferase n=1 Tax=Moritella marina ATCC 15381 TaxID=1202962 RepID=A0A5J6WIL2_MORMI|nr:GNAT family N-acetyltransferase [Moritella marina]QFI37021.1 N-acetyltransferase [Moritella marina ATCC 15381]
MNYSYRLAKNKDLNEIVDIYNHSVKTLESTCDIEPITLSSRQPSFTKQLNDPIRPFWVAELTNVGITKVVGYLNFSYFMNERPGYYVTADLAIYLHPKYQGKGVGSFLLSNAIEKAPSLGIQTLCTTIFDSNIASKKLFKKHNFQDWGLMPGVAMLNGVNKDLRIVGRTL